MTLPRLLLLIAVFTIILATAATGYLVVRHKANLPEAIPIIATPSIEASATPSGSPTATASSTTSKTGKVNTDDALKKLDAAIDGADGSAFKDSYLSNSQLGL